MFPISNNQVRKKNEESEPHFDFSLNRAAFDIDYELKRKRLDPQHIVACIKCKK